MGRQSLGLANRFSTVWPVLSSLLRQSMGCLAPIAWYGPCCCHHPCRPSRLLPGEVPQQHISTSEVAALPLTQVKPYKTLFLVPYHRSFAGRSPLGVTDQSRGSAPLVEAGCHTMGFDIGCIHHQYPCLCAVGLCQLAEEQLEYTVVGPASETVVEGFVWSINGRCIHPGQASRSTWAIPPPEDLLGVLRRPGSDREPSGSGLHDSHNCG